jgi:hypothetical protein
MKKLIPLIIFIAGIVIFPFLFLTTASASDPPITIRLLSDKTIYQPGEAIKMQIEVLSTQAIITRKGFFEQPFHLMITFIDPDGKPITSSYLQPGNEPGPPYRVDDRDAVLAEDIQNGASKTIVLDNAYALYDLTKSGRYTAQVFTSLETFSQSSTDPFGNLIAFLDDAGKQSFSPSSNKISFETASPAPGQLAIIQPNSGEVIPSGSTYVIKWAAPSNAVRFDLKYSMNNGTTWKPIASKVTGTSFSWTVPIPKNNKKKCLVKVIGYNAVGTKMGEDRSDDTFTIEVIKVTSPDGGESLSHTYAWTIRWRTNGTVKPVAFSILYYTQDGSTWKLILPRIDNLGFYPWEVPYVASAKTKCKVKVVLKAADGTTVGSDISDMFFTIQP